MAAIELYRGAIPIIDFSLPPTDLSHPKGVTFGAVPRDYNVDPETMFAAPSGIQLVPASEWDARYDEQERTKSSLEHMYLGPDMKSPAFENLDQDQEGYCWSYSTGHALMFDRLRANLPLIRLNPHAAAAIIKRGRNEGGWCGLSARWAEEHGFAVEGDGPGQWPLHSRDLKHDTPLLREQMAKFKVTDAWRDLTRQDWDQKMTTAQLATCGFNNVPAASDFNWWGHSVCQIRWVRIEKGSWGPLIINSWKRWGRFGLAVLRGKQAIADAAVATLGSVATAA